MEEEMNSLKRTARVAGILYIIMDVCLIFSGMYVDPKLYVPGDTVATVGNILGSEWLFRLGFVSNLVGLMLQLFLVYALYELFKSVDKVKVRLMVILIVAGISVAFLNTLNQYAPILFFSNDAYLSTFNRTQLQTMAMIFLDLYNHGTIIAEIFWGLWLIPLGLLVYRSGFVPRMLGVLLMIGCLGHLISFFSTFLFPNHSAILTPTAETAMIGELPIFLWLLIRGVKDQRPVLVEVG